MSPRAPEAQALPVHDEFMDVDMRALWRRMGPLPGQLRLYGGTALALYLNHRESVDFDFFTPDPDVRRSVITALPWLAGATWRGWRRRHRGILARDTSRHPCHLPRSCRARAGPRRGPATGIEWRSRCCPARPCSREACGHLQPRRGQGLCRRRRGIRCLAGDVRCRVLHRPWTYRRRDRHRVGESTG